MSKDIMIPSTIEHNLSLGLSSEKALSLRKKEIFQLLRKIPVLDLLKTKTLNARKCGNFILFHTDSNQILITATKIMSMGKWTGKFELAFESMTFALNDTLSNECAYEMDVTLDNKGELNIVNIIQLFREIYQLPVLDLDLASFYQEYYGYDLSKVFENDYLLGAK